MKSKSNHQLVEEFLLWLSVNRTKATVSSFKWALRQFEHWLTNNEKLILDLQPSDIASYILHLRKRGLKKGTQSIYVTAVRSMWTWLEENNLAPFRKSLIPTIQTEDVKSYLPISYEEYRAILGCLSGNVLKDIRDRAMISLLWDTGMRLGELQSLNLLDINLRTMSGKVKTFKRRNHFRTFYFSEEVCDYLKSWLEVRGGIITRYNGSHLEPALFISMNTGNDCGRIYPPSIQQVVRELCRKAGISRRITVHSFRHGFGTRFNNAGMNVRTLQELMGHAKIGTTMIYMHKDESQLEQEYRQFNMS